MLRDPSLAERVGGALLASPFTSILRVNEELFMDAWERFKPSTGTSFTDCTSFTFMERNGIGTALTYDRRFSAAGFKTL